MQKFIRTAVIVLNTALFTMCGYLYGYYQGSNLPTVDKSAIDEAIFQAMMEQ